MNRHHRSHLEDRENFIPRHARFERSADVPARALGVEARAGGIERHADQLISLRDSTS
jgi:hypothetical protein